jgi:signal peptide peptidase SppA
MTTDNNTANNTAARPTHNVDPPVPGTLAGVNDVVEMLNDRQDDSAPEADTTGPDRCVKFRADPIAGSSLSALRALDPVWQIQYAAVPDLCAAWHWINAMSQGVSDDTIKEAIANSAEPAVIAARHRRMRSLERVEGAVAVLPIRGVIFHRPNMFTRWGFGVSSEEFGRVFDEMAANSDVGAIVLDIDSPGGMHAGTEDLANKIFLARKAGRPIIAISNDMMASAAYWIASAADEIVASRGSITGSIGTILIHTEYSKALSDAGIVVNIIHAGQFKKEGNPYEPLTESARKHMQSLVDSAYADLIKSVAKHREVELEVVTTKYGQGRVYGEAQAVQRGLVDREATLDAVLIQLGVKSPGKGQSIGGGDHGHGYDSARRRAALGRPLHSPASTK